jgi:hypothetical protein
MTAERLAQVIGTALRHHSSSRCAWSTDPEPARNWSSPNPADDGEPIPGTLVMNYDGEIDLMELAKAILETKEAA